MRTVIGFESLGTRTVFKLENAPTNIPGIRTNAFIDVSPPPGENVAVQGEALMQRLQLHQPVHEGLAAALAQPAGAGPCPLYFHMVSASADALPWEQLYAAPHGFCVLDQRWPIGRIARRQRDLNDRAFAPPLHLVAVLSAGPRRSGLGQLETLLAAVGSADAAAIGVSLHVLSGEQAVLDAVTAAGLANVTSDWIATKPGALAHQIAAEKPQLVHLLCHGGAVAGVHTLTFATLADFDADEELGSVRLKVPDLTGALLPCDPWLVVLAACDTADAADGPALAHDIVDHGVPAVIGMRRLVDLGATDQFCAALYPEVLAVVRTTVSVAAGNGPPVARAIDWAPALSLPRMAISGPDPCAVDTWSDPVLYVQDDPLRVFPSSAAWSPTDYAMRRAKLDVWNGVRATLDPATTDPAFLADVDKEIAALEADLGLGGRG